MMNFAQANRAEVPPYLQAAYEQAQIAAALRQQQQNEAQMYGSAAAELATQVPAGAWGNLGNAIMGKTAAGAATPVLTDAATGALASAAPTAANSAAALTGVNTVAAPMAGAAAGGAAPGVTGALGALGPMGWAALLAGGLMASRL